LMDVGVGSAEGAAVQIFQRERIKFANKTHTNTLPNAGGKSNLESLRQRLSLLRTCILLMFHWESGVIRLSLGRKYWRSWASIARASIWAGGVLSFPIIGSRGFMPKGQLLR
jgi:hypothetical protein